MIVFCTVVLAGAFFVFGSPTSASCNDTGDAGNCGTSEPIWVGVVVSISVVGSILLVVYGLKIIVYDVNWSPLLSRGFNILRRGIDICKDYGPLKFVFLVVSDMSMSLRLANLSAQPSAESPTPVAVGREFAGENLRNESQFAGGLPLGVSTSSPTTILGLPQTIMSPIEEVEVDITEDVAVTLVEDERNSAWRHFPFLAQGTNGSMSEISTTTAVGAASTPPRRRTTVDTLNVVLPAQ